MYRFIALFICICLAAWTSHSQTELLPGDLAIIGINANNGSCSGVTGEDLISIVFFRDITTGTTLDMTDNGWEALNPGFFGNREGAYRFTRTGGTLPAGTVVTFSLPAVGGTPSATSPDNEWAFTRLNSQATNVNLNANGDQIFFFQGGTWDDGDTGFEGNQQNAQYVGGRMLFAFNTKTTWQAGQNDSDDSGLPPEVAPCFFMAPSGAASDFLYYDGPNEAAPPLSWIARLSNPNNWSGTASCASYPDPPENIAIDPTLIDINCITCQGCAPYEAAFSIRLPEEAGPYELTLVVGGDTLNIPNYTAGDTLRQPVDADTPVELVAVADIRGCAVQLQERVEVSLDYGLGTSLPEVDPIRLCDEGSGTATFNLVQIGQTIRQNPGDSVYWYVNADTSVAVTNPLSFRSGSRTLYAVARQFFCESNIREVALVVDPIPRINLLDDGIVCPTDCHTISLDMEGVGPFFLQYQLRINDQWQPLSLGSDQTDTSMTICPDLGRATQIEFLSLSDAQCITELNTTFTLNTFDLATDTLTGTYCAGDSVLIRGAWYSAEKTSGQDTVVGVAPNGCDSIYVIDLTFTEPVGAVSIAGDSRICRDEDAVIRVSLPDDARYRIAYSIGEEETRTVLATSNPFSITFSPASSTTFRLEGVGRADGGCLTTQSQTLDIEVIDLDLDLDPVSFIGCTSPNGGALRAIPSGGMEPYLYAWNTGATVADITGLGAGEYRVQVTDGTGCVVDGVYFMQAPQPLDAVIEEQPAECVGESSRLIISSLSGGQGGYSYSFDGATEIPIGTTPFVIDNYPSDALSLYLSDAGDCELEQPLMGGSPEDLTISLGEDQTIVRGDTATLVATLHFTPASIQWSVDNFREITGELSRSVAPDRTKVYRITATTEAGCRLSATVTVFVTEPELPYFAPTVFSPNQDGRNDYFVLYGGPQLYQILEFQVYNRWGATVFSARDITPGDEERGWDGRTGLYDQPAGTYVFRAEIQFTNGERQQVSGSVTLIR